MSELETRAVRQFSINDAMNIFQGVSTYREEKRKGATTTEAIAKSAVASLWTEFYYGSIGSAISKIPTPSGVAGAGMGLGLQLGIPIALSIVPQFTIQASENTTRVMTEAYSQRGKLGSGYFNMNDAGYTMRQRSLNAIRNNGLVTQSALGNEARTYYFSS